MSGIFSIFIPIIFFIIVYSLRKSKSESSPKETKGNKYAMPSIGQDWMPQTMRQIGTAESGSEPKPKVKESVKDRDREFNQSVGYNIKRMEQIADSPIDDQSEENQVYEIHAGDKGQYKRTKESLSFNSEHIAQGILLAEVLGPPRARKPHQATLHRK